MSWTDGSVNGVGNKEIANVNNAAKADIEFINGVDDDVYYSFNATIGTSPSGTVVTVYTTQSNLSNIAISDTLYINPTGTVYASTTFSIHSSTQQPKFNCSGSQVAIFTTNASGVITSQSCGNP
ncbi:unnamed protein product [marine sediment metagenome]|uniref:Uncharacterized protein n=2 Tax=marine sediment metagenome TaxID=412755 RepID=X1B7S0_9ZZZZ